MRTHDPQSDHAAVGHSDRDAECQCYALCYGDALPHVDTDRHGDPVTHCHAVAYLDAFSDPHGLA